MNQEPIAKSPVDEPPEPKRSDYVDEFFYKGVLIKGLEYLATNFPNLEERVYLMGAVGMYNEGRRADALPVFSDVRVERSYGKFRSQLCVIFNRGLSDAGYTTNNGEAREIQSAFNDVFNLYYALKNGIEVR